MGLVEDLQRIKDESAALERRRARREADIEMARSRRDEAMEELRSEYGVDDVPAAKDLLKALAAETAREIAAAEAALREVPE
jgi:hypothetical protein